MCDLFLSRRAGNFIFCLDCPHRYVCLTDSAEEDPDLKERIRMDCRERAREWVLGNAVIPWTSPDFVDKEELKERGRY